jgi:hypothetical protein
VSDSETRTKLESATDVTIEKLSDLAWEHAHEWLFDVASAMFEDEMRRLTGKRQEEQSAAAEDLRSELMTQALAHVVESWLEDLEGGPDPEEPAPHTPPVAVNVVPAGTAGDIEWEVQLLKDRLEPGAEVRIMLYERAFCQVWYDHTFRSFWYVFADSNEMLHDQVRRGICYEARHAADVAEACVTFIEENEQQS